MPQFTEQDIITIKDKVNYFMQVIRGGGTIAAYMNTNIITEVQLLNIKTYLLAHYPNIDFYPLPKELQPLIDLSQHLVDEENKVKRKKKYDTTVWDRWDYGDQWDDGRIWGDGYN